MKGWIKLALVGCLTGLVTIAAIVAVAFGPRLLWIWHVSQTRADIQHGDLQAAEREANAALSTARSTCKDQLCGTFSLVASVYIAQAKYSQAQPIIDEWLKTAREQSGPHSIDLVRAYAISGAFYRRQARYDEAAQQYKLALDAASKGVDQNDPSLCDVNYALAKLDIYLEKAAPAKALFEQALRAARSQSPVDPMRSSRALAGLGDVDEFYGRYGSALAKYKQASQTNTDNPGETAELLDHMVPLYLAQNKLNEAQTTALKAQELLKHADGEAYVNTSDTIVEANLAAVYLATGKDAEAQPLVEDVLKQLAARVSAKHAGYANALILYARLQTHLGRFDKAKAALDQALPILEKTCGKKHRFIAELTRRRAELEMASGNSEKSEQDFRDAIEIARTTLPPQHPQIAGIMQSHAELLRKLNRHSEAEKLDKEAKQMLDHAENS
ncbi:MAG TPA: tetratricopeptide repeat protein [Planktothrix sp.]|jgi:hypothetical protein